MYRKSMEVIRHMVREIPYPGAIPAEIRHLHYYVLDAGHAIVCVPKVLLSEVNTGNYWEYEVPLPVKYVLKTGWDPIPGTDAISVDVPYSEIFGAEVPDGYDEF